MCKYGKSWCPRVNLCEDCKKETSPLQPKGFSLPKKVPVTPSKSDAPKEQAPSQVQVVPTVIPQVEAPKNKLEWGMFESNCKAVHIALVEQRKTPKTYLRKQAQNPYDHNVCANLPKSIKLGQQGTRVPFLIDQLYSVLAWTGRVSVCVHTDEAQGRGDLMLGVKATRALRVVFPLNAENKHDIVLLTSASAVQKQPQVFATCDLPFAVLPGQSANPSAQPLSEGVAGPLHILVAPQLAVTKNLQTTAKASWKSESLIAMTEYSKAESAPMGSLGPTYASGLGDNELGITFDAGHRTYKKEQDTLKETPKQQRKARLEHLRAVGSKHLILALFPGVELTGLDAALGSFIDGEHSRLYFSYSNKSAARFALIVAAVEREHAHDVHVIQACPEFWNDNIKLTSKWLKEQLGDPTCKEWLGVCGVGKVQLVEFQVKDSTVATRTLYTIGAQGKTLHLVFTLGTPPTDMAAFIRASEVITMMTGNQSTSEALSAGKTILYESIGMVQSLAFCNSLYDSAGVAKLDKEAIIAISRDFDRVKTGQQPPGLGEFASAATALLNIRASGKLAEFSDVASASKDLGRWLGGHFLRKMLLSCDSLKGGLEAQEELVKTSWKDPNAYYNFVQYLLKLVD